MKLNNSIKKISRVIGFVILLFVVGCSSKILSENQTNISPTPESCERFAGEWQANMFEETEDESRMICDGKPCLDYNRGGSGFRLNCNDGKLTGEVILWVSTYGMQSNIAVPNKTPVPVREITAPLKESRLEDGILYLSYGSGDAADADCLKEIRVKSKGDLLIGTYKITGCENKSSGLSKKAKELLRTKPTGGVVLEKW